MYREHSKWLDAISFVGLVALVIAAFSLTIWPRTSAQAADSFAHMLEGLTQVIDDR